MKVSLLLVALLPFCYADNSNFFQNYIRLYLNESISPCDDFFGHVCSAAPSTEHYILKKDNLWVKRVQPYLSDHCQDIIADIQLIAKMKPFVFEDDVAERLAVDEVCTSDRRRCRKIIEFALGEGFTENMTAENITAIVFDMVHVDPKDPAASIIQDIPVTTGKLCYLEALYRKIEADSKIYMPQIEKAEARLDKLVDKLKKILVKHFPETKWMRNSGSVKKYQKLITDIERKTVFNESYRLLAEKYVNKAKECSGLMFGWHSQEIYGCMLYALHNTLKEMKISSEHLFLPHALTFNAGYLTDINAMGASVVVTLQSLAGGLTEVGTTGFILAHELAHSMFHPQVNISSLSIENIDCIYKHRQEICKESNFLCKMGNVTITEDAPDIMALVVALDLFEQEKEELDGNPAEFSKEQYFFYTLAATLCTHELNHQQDSPGVFNTHSPGKGRINALLMHSKTFQSAFDCQPNDAMWREPDNFCHLLGPDANRR